MPRAPKTIGLALPKTLRSNDLSAIQDFFQLWKDKLDLMYKLLLSDITTIEIGSGNWIYFGGKNVADSVRIGKIAGTTEFLVQLYIGGVYTSRLGVDT